MTNVIVRIFIAEISKILIAAFKIDDVLYSLITLVTAMLHQTAYGCFLGFLIFFQNLPDPDKLFLEKYPKTWMVEF